MAAPTTNQRYRYHNLQVHDSGGGALWRWSVVLLLVAATALSYVWLRSNTQKITQRRQSMAKDEEIFGKEMSNLRVTAESFRNGHYILQAVERLGLELRPPLEGQVRRVSLATGPEPVAKAESMLAQLNR